MTLPIDRTSLTAAQSNQVPSQLIQSSKNIAAITAVFNGVDEVYNYTTGLIGSGTLSRLGIVNVRDYNAKADGSNDTAAFVAAIAAGTTIIVPNGTYSIDTITITKKVHIILAKGAILKCRTGGVVIKFDTGSDSSSFIGGTIDGNRTALLSGYLSTSSWHGISAANVPGIHLDDITIQNCLGIGLKLDDCNYAYVNRISIYRSLWGFSTRNCNYANMFNIDVIDLTSDQAGQFPHGMDIKNATGLIMKNLRVLNSDGSLASSSTALSGVTISGLIDANIDNITINGMISTTLRPLAFSCIGMRHSHITNLTIIGYGGGRSIECLGMEDSSIIGGYVDGGYTLTGAGTANADTAIFVSNSGIYYNETNFSRSDSSSNGNVFQDILIRRVQLAGVRLWSSNNKFINVRVEGSLTYGFYLEAEGDNDSADGAFPGAPSDPCENNYLINCSAIGCSQEGIHMSSLKNATIIGGRYDNNGQVGSFKNLYADPAFVQNGIEIRNASFKDTQALMFPAANRYSSIGITSLTGVPSFSVMVIQTDNIFPNQRLLLKGIGPAAADLTVRVTDKTLDEITVEPISATTGALTIPLTLLTGTVSTTAGSNVVTGVGTLFIAEIVGRYFIKIGTETHKVAQVISNTSLRLVDNFVGTLAAQPINSIKFEIQGIASSQYGIHAGASVQKLRISDVNTDGCTAKGIEYLAVPAAEILELPLGSQWNLHHMILGAYHIWVDSTGNERIKNGLPTSDTDGSPFNLGRSGTTASRPTTGLYIGYPYFDTTLGYSINVKSLGPTVWVNGAGTTV